MSGPPLRVELHASPALTLVTGLLHGLAAAVLWSVLPAGAGFPVAILVLALGAIAIHQKTLLRSSTAPATFGLRRDGTLTVGCRDGREVEAVAAERRYVTRWLVVLDLLHPPLRGRTVLIARDMLAPAQFRYLRLWALWKTLPVDAPSTSA